MRQIATDQAGQPEKIGRELLDESPSKGRIHRLPRCSLTVEVKQPGAQGVNGRDSSEDGHDLARERRVPDEALNPSTADPLVLVRQIEIGRKRFINAEKLKGRTIGRRRVSS